MEQSLSQEEKTEFWNCKRKASVLFFVLKRVYLNSLAKLERDSAGAQRWNNVSSVRPTVFEEGLKNFEMTAMAAILDIGTKRF